MATMWVSVGGGELIPLDVETYSKERDFQAMLAESPELLADAIDGGESKWLLIDRELPIKPTESEGGTWSLDHLFVGPDARPVLVEVKRSSDPRARREVVAQMLDYAASFSFDWSAGLIRDRRLNRKGSSSAELSAEIEAFLDSTASESESTFWAEVQTRIEAGEIRLLFVADQISPTLRRIIEYLNDQLRTAEVLGVEVVRHAGSNDAVVFQPVVHGRSTTHGSKKGPTQRRSKDEFDAALLETLNPKVLAGVNQLVDAVRSLGGFESMGTGETSPTLYLNLRTKGTGLVYWPFLLNPKTRKFIVRIRKLRKHPSFEDVALQEELLDRVAAAFQTELQGNTSYDRWAPLDLLSDPVRIEAISGLLAWVKSTADTQS